MGMRGGGASHLGVPSYGRRASSASVMHPKMPPMNKKGSIPNLGKRGSTSSGGGISGLVINPPKIVKVCTSLYTHGHKVSDIIKDVFLQCTIFSFMFDTLC